MDQVSALIESMCSIRDHDFRRIEQKQVESYKNLPQMMLARAVPIAPRDAPMIAVDFRVLSASVRDGR